MKPNIHEVTVLATIPHEWLTASIEKVCILHGKVRDDGSSTITGFVETDNLSTHPKNHYKAKWRKSDDAIIGILHSHPVGLIEKPTNHDRHQLPWWMLGGVYQSGKIVWFTSSQPNPYKNKIVKPRLDENGWEPF